MPKIHVERMMHRQSIAVLGESAVSYALVKLIPTGLGEGAPQRKGLNLALVLDVSGSMYEEDGTGISRLKRIQDAAVSAMDMLKPEDSMCIVGFAHNAMTLLPPTKLSEKDKIVDIIRKVDMFDVDPGGTAMNDGMRIGLQEVEKISGPGQISQLVVLTDGETSGEQDCRALATDAGKKGIQLTIMGVGLDWKSALIKDLASLSNGKWYYIDVNSKTEADRIFHEEFQSLAATAFSNVRMHLRPMKDVKIKRLRQVAPEIKKVDLQEPEERHLIGAIGTLEKDKTVKYIIDLSLPKRPDGKFVIAQMELTYDIGTGKDESSGQIPLEMTYTAAGHGYINAEVARHIDDVQLYELNENLQKEITKGNQEEVKKVAEQIEKKADIMGKRAAKKTMLAKQVLDELNVSGRVSKKTQLAMEDNARMADELPPS